MTRATRRTKTGEEVADAAALRRSHGRHSTATLDIGSVEFCSGVPSEGHKGADLSSCVRVAWILGRRPWERITLQTKEKLYDRGARSMFRASGATAPCRRASLCQAPSEETHKTLAVLYPATAANRALRPSSGSARATCVLHADCEVRLRTTEQRQQSCSLVEWAALSPWQLYTQANPERARFFGLRGTPNRAGEDLFCSVTAVKVRGK